MKNKLVKSIKAGQLGSLCLVVLLILSMILSMIPAYALTGTVEGIGGTTEDTTDDTMVTVSSWDELVGKFGSSSTSIEIPSGTEVYVAGMLTVPDGSYEITGGTFKRDDSFTKRMFNIGESVELTIKDSVIDGQSDKEVLTAIYLRSGILNLENTNIVNNPATEEGGAVNCYYGTLNIQGGLFENNKATDGAAVHVTHGVSGGVINATGATFRGNEGNYTILINTTGNDTGIGDISYLTDCNIESNTGGGITTQSRAGNYKLVIDDCNIESNTAESGAGLNIGSIAYGEVEVKNSTISNNIASNDGGGITTSRRFTLENTRITGNESAERGGAIFSVYDLAIEVNGGEISGNTDTNEGTRADSSGIRLGPKGSVTLTGGVSVADGIEAGTVNVYGKVNMTGYISTASSVGYTVTGALDSTSSIEVKGNWSSEFNHVEGNEAERIYDVARPAAGYSITQQDFEAFKIDGQSGHTAPDTGKLGLYMGTELSNLEYYNTRYDNDIVAWRGPGEASNTYTITWDTQIDGDTPIQTSQKQGEKVVLPSPTPVDPTGQKEFIGWFTEKENGQQVTADTVYEKSEDSTYYAHWKEASKTVNVYIKAYHDPLQENDDLMIYIDKYENGTPGENVFTRFAYENQEVWGLVDKGTYRIQAIDGEYNIAEKIVTINADNQHIELVIKEQQIPESFKIYGTVIDRLTPNKLVGWTVELYQVNTAAVGSAFVKNTITDTQGYYEFGDLPNGSYIVKVVPDDDSIPEESENVNIYLKDEEVNFEMGNLVVLTYRITGTIKDSNGKILTGATVELKDTSGKVLGTVTVDSTGQYEFIGLADGRYQLDGTSGVGSTSSTGTISGQDIVINLVVNVEPDVPTPPSGGDGGTKPVDPGDTEGPEDTKPENKPQEPQEPEEKPEDTKPEEKPQEPQEPEDTKPEEKPQEPQEPEEKPEEKPQEPEEKPEDTKPEDKEPEHPEQTQEPEDQETEQPIQTPNPQDNKPTDTSKPENTDKPNDIKEPETTITAEPEEPVETDEPEDESTLKFDDKEIINIPADNDKTEIDETDKDNEIDTSLTGANGTFKEVLRRILYMVSFSILMILGIGLIWWFILLWYRRVKLYNDVNTDEYEDERYELVYKGYIKKEERGIYYIVIPEKIIEQRTTDKFQLQLKELFIRRHNGDMLMVDIEGTKLVYSFEIDEKENTVKFDYSDFTVEE